VSAPDSVMGLINPVSEEPDKDEIPEIIVPLIVRTSDVHERFVDPLGPLSLYKIELFGISFVIPYALSMYCLVIAEDGLVVTVILESIPFVSVVVVFSLLISILWKLFNVFILMVSLLEYMISPCMSGACDVIYI